MPKGAEACRGTDCLQAAYVFGSVLTSNAPGDLDLALGDLHAFAATMAALGT